MARAITFPLKYKFLGVMLFVVLSALSVFLYVAQQTFSDDKKLFIMDSNRTLLKAATSEIKLELKGRLEELQQFIPRVYMGGSDKLDPFQGLSPSFPEELIGVTFYKAGSDGNFTAIKEFTNMGLVQKQKLPAEILKRLNEAHPVSLKNIDKTQGVDMVNRSIHLNDPNSPGDVAVLTFVLGANFMNDASKELFIVVDFSQTFLMRTLAQSELTEVFLLFGEGNVLSHPVLRNTVEYATKIYPHPIVEKMKDKKFTRESLELEVDGEDYLCNISETGFKNVFAISQIRKSEAFLALKTLVEKSMLLALIILAASTVFSVFFASGLTTNIKKLRLAAEQLGAGNLDIKLHVRSSDEIQGVAQSFQWMANQVKTLIQESADKARLADELETARLVQSTLLTPPTIDTKAIEMVSHYLAATECGGDYWDARVAGPLFTIFIGDATGHGAPAAIVTAVAKSCFATLSMVYADNPLPPEQLLTELNRIIYGACRGKLLMTMCIIQLNMETGEVLVGSAGHESPLCLRGNKEKSGLNVVPALPTKKSKAEIDVLFSRGERLGFAPDATYEVERIQMKVGDTILLYTDGISEAKSEEGKEWGERALKKAFGAGRGESLENIKARLTQGLGEHTQGAVQEDDVTFVLFQWKEQLAGSNRTSNSIRVPARLGMPVIEAVATATTPAPIPVLNTEPPPSPEPPSIRPHQEDYSEESEVRDAMMAGLPEPEQEQSDPGKQIPKKPKAA